MFNVGGPEIVVIILVALLVLGPEQLPKAMRTFGNVMTQVRKVSGGFQAELRSVMDSVTDGIDPTKPSKPAVSPTPTPSSPEPAPATAVDADIDIDAATEAEADERPGSAPSPSAAEPEPHGEPEPVLVRAGDLADRAAG